MEMQKVDKYISELLYDYDCVIVPNFGGFVSNYSPAKIHPVHHTFSPPSKSIVFNKNLKHNDGLLANQVASSQNTNYTEALRQIDHFVQQTNTLLKEGKKVKIEEVGTLYWDVERNIQFDPSTRNYLTEAFGLVQFQSPAIKRDALGKRILDKQLKDREPVALPNRKKTIKRLVALTIAVPLIAAIIWIPYKNNFFENTHKADLNPFQLKKTEQVVKQEPVETAPPIESDSSNSSVSTSSTTITASQPTEETSVTPVKADTTAVSITRSEAVHSPFHVVAGCFQIEANAVKYIDILQQQQINASIIGQNEKGLYVVSCGDFETRQEATEKLNELRNQNQSVWLYKKL